MFPKTLLVVLLLGFMLAPTFVEAKNYRVNSFYRTHPRAKKFKITTKVINRQTKSHTATSYGKTYRYYRTIITYKDIYSDGTTRIWRSTI